MTAFDTAWRKEREDALASQLQDAYDGVEESQSVQRFIHVADPIEVMMPNNPKPQPMFRDHISSTRLVNDEGEYIDAKEAFEDMMDDLKNLARPRKNPKDPKYARIFIPNPQSKMKEIGDFHLDEGKSEEWQEKNASEPMTAFDTAWELIKMPLDFDSIRDVGIITHRDVPHRRFEADFVDPETQERLSAYAQMSEKGRGVGRIHAPEHHVGRAIHLIDNYGDEGIYPSTIFTSPEYRKRGYQEALLHLIMRLAEAEGRTFVEPHKSFKTGDGNMFANRMREKHDDSNIGVME